MVKDDRRCSFCGKKEGDVQRLVAGGDPRGVFICNECVRLLCANEHPEDIRR